MTGCCEKAPLQRLKATNVSRKGGQQILVTVWVAHLCPSVRYTNVQTLAKQLWVEAFA